MDELEPAHVDLGASGAAPLTGLEEDETDGATGETHFLEFLDEAALGA